MSHPPDPDSAAQDDLFGGAAGAPAEDGPAVAPRAPAPAPASPVRPSAFPQAQRALADALALQVSDRLHLGTSSWHFPGWAGLVYARSYPPAMLSRHGLQAYAQHPLLRAVSLDRAFYRPLDAPTYAALAAQVPQDFRFVVKAPALVTDALLRDPADGRGLQPNPSFLDPATARDLCAAPAAEGLGDRLGVLVFQVSPLPGRWLQEPARLIERLEALWAVVVPALPPGSVAALELRDPSLLTPSLAASLKACAVRYCLGLHDRMPPIEQQLPMLRATWPGPLVCRWNLQRGLRYASAKDQFAPFDRLQAPDPGTRATLARVVAGTLAAGGHAYVTINNKAEGSAPCSVDELAQAVLRALSAPAGDASRAALREGR